MKRNLLIGIIGLASAASAISQGHITIAHYFAPPYHQLTWYLPDSPVNDAAIQVQVFYGEGVITETGALQPGEVVSINPAYSYNGGGYYDPINQILPDWEPGDTYTFYLRASGDTSFGQYINVTGFWTEQSNIVSTSEPTLLALNIGPWTGIPEPSTLALAGAGLGAAWLAFLRRKGPQVKSILDTKPNQTLRDKL